MKIGTLGEKNHADSKYGIQFALKAIPDYEPLMVFTKKCTVPPRQFWVYL